MKNKSSESSSALHAVSSREKECASLQNKKFPDQITSVSQCLQPMSDFQKDSEGSWRNKIHQKPSKLTHELRDKEERDISE